MSARGDGRRTASRAAPVLVAAARLLVATGVLLAGAPAPAAAMTQATWPVVDDDGGPPEISRRFDPPADLYGRGHRGVDLAARPGAQVVAAAAGRVSYAGMLAGRGVLVVVHGALRTTYEPVTAAVSVGQQVQAGELIGSLDPGHAGCAASACLHWGLRRGRQYLDPVSLLGAGPVRLLPLGASAETPPSAIRQAATVARASPAAATRSGSGVAVQPLSPPDEQVVEPWLSLRSTLTPTGALALIALLAGLVLLRTPTRPRRGPASAQARAVPLDDVDATPPTGAEARDAVLDLAAARDRRRAALG